MGFGYIKMIKLDSIYVILYYVIIHKWNDISFIIQIDHG